MGSLSLHLVATLNSMGQWINLAALAAGVLAGLALQRVLWRAGCDAVAPLALLFPIAALLDPFMALIVLASAFGAQLVAGQKVGAGWQTVVSVCVVALAVVLLVGPMVQVMPQFGAAEKLLLAVGAAGGAVMVHARREPGAWLAAVVMMLAGLAVQFTPWPLIESSKMSPRWVICALLLVGPALVTLMWPERARLRDAGSALIEPGASLISLLMLAVPVTSAAALFSLVLGEHGLSGGYALVVQRPRLALGFSFALVVGAVSAVGLFALSRAMRLAAFGQKIAVSPMARVCAAVVLTAVGAMAARLGFEPAEIGVAAVALAIGVALAWFGLPAGVFVVGLVLGESMKVAFPAAAKLGFGGARPVMVAVVACFAVGSALAWPWISARFRQKREV